MSLLNIVAVYFQASKEEQAVIAESTLVAIRDELRNEIMQDLREFKSTLSLLNSSLAHTDDTYSRLESECVQALQSGDIVINGALINFMEHLSVTVTERLPDWFIVQRQVFEAQGEDVKLTPRTISVFEMEMYSDRIEIGPVWFQGRHCQSWRVVDDNTTIFAPLEELGLDLVSNRRH